MSPASRQDRETATAGVITRPPFLYLTALLLGLALDRVLPLAIILRYGVVAREEVYLERGNCHGRPAAWFWFSRR